MPGRRGGQERGGGTIPAGAVVARVCANPHPSVAGERPPPGLPTGPIRDGVDALVDAVNAGGRFDPDQVCTAIARPPFAVVFLYDDGFVRAAFVDGSGCGRVRVGGHARGGYDEVSDTLAMLRKATS